MITRRSQGFSSLETRDTGDKLTSPKMHCTQLHCTVLAAWGWRGARDDFRKVGGMGTEAVHAAVLKIHRYKPRGQTAFLQYEKRPNLRPEILTC